MSRTDEGIYYYDTSAFTFDDGRPILFENCAYLHEFIGYVLDEALADYSQYEQHKDDHITIKVPDNVQAMHGDADYCDKNGDLVYEILDWSLPVKPTIMFVRGEDVIAKVKYHNEF